MAARADIEAGVAVAAETVPLDRAATLVGLAGSVTTVAAMALDLPAYDRDAIHHAPDRCRRRPPGRRAAAGA